MCYQVSEAHFDCSRRPGLLSAPAFEYFELHGVFVAEKLFLPVALFDARIGLCSSRVGRQMGCQVSNTSNYLTAECGLWAWRPTQEADQIAAEG